MDFPERTPQEGFLSPKQPPLNLRQAFTGFQNHCSGLVRHLSQLPLFHPNTCSSKAHLQSTLSNLQNLAKQAFGPPVAGSVSRNVPVWARIDVNNDTQLAPGRQSAVSLSNEVIEERLAGVPVYALSNAAEEFVLVSGLSTGKSLGLFCFKQDDAEALLQQMKSMDPDMRSGSKVVPVALNKVFQLKVDGVAFRLIPESSQIKNALREMEKAGQSDNAFSGVPVFQSRSLVLKSEDKSYRPLFFRKEDLDDSLLRASRSQNQLNPSFRQGDIQVAVLEDIIKGMKENSTSTWDDVVFIPPGFDVSTDPNKL